MYKIFSSWLFYFMLAHFFLLVWLFGANLKNLYQKIKKIDKKIWLLLLLVFIAGFYLRNSEYWLGPHSDGYVAQESAHLWLLHGEFVKACALGNQIDCQLFEQVLAPPGSPFIIALTHLFFGIRSLNASIVSAVLSSLTILLVFLISYFIFKKEEIGLYAALIFSFIPLNIVNSQTGLSRPTGLFFIGLTVLFYLLALKNNKFISWLLTIVCLSYAIYVRQESYVLLPFLFIFFVVFKWSAIKRFFKNIVRKGRADFKIILQADILVLVFLILQIPVLRWLLINNPYNTYQGDSFLGLHYQGLLIQGKAIFEQLFNQSVFGPIFHHNIVISVIFLVTSLFLIISWKKKYIFILGLFLAYFFLYSLMSDSYLQGTDQLTGDYFRRTLMLHLPYAVVAGYGIYLLNPLKKRKFLLVGLLPLLILILFGESLFLSKFSWSYRGEDYNQSNYDFYFPKSLFKDVRAEKGSWTNDYFAAVGKTPNDALVITGVHILVTNDYFKDSHRKVASIDLINESTEDLFLDELRKSNCLIYIEDYRCKPSYRSGNDYSCQFLEKHLKKTFLFKEGDIKVYQAELVDESK